MNSSFIYLIVLTVAVLAIPLIPWSGMRRRTMAPARSQMARSGKQERS